MTLSRTMLLELTSGLTRIPGKHAVFTRDPGFLLAAEDTLRAREHEVKAKIIVRGRRVSPREIEVEDPIVCGNCADWNRIGSCRRGERQSGHQNRGRKETSVPCVACVHGGTR